MAIVKEAAKKKLFKKIASKTEAPAQKKLKRKEKKLKKLKNECIYRPVHRDTNDDRDTGNINDDRDKGTQLQRERRGAGGYINDDGDTGNVRLAITICKFYVIKNI